MCSDANNLSDKHQEAHDFSLKPTPLLPHRYSRASQPMTLLQEVVQVTISDVFYKQGENKAFYVLDVYLYHEQSRIPSNQTKNRLLKQLVKQQVPDFQVTHCFSDFATLRDEISYHAQGPHRSYCEYCDRICFYTFFNMTQPRLWVKLLGISTKTRTKILEKFLHSMLQLSSQRIGFYHRCEGLEHIPQLMVKFLQLERNLLHRGDRESSNNNNINV